MVSEGISVFLKTLESLLTFSAYHVPEGLSSRWCSRIWGPHGEGWKCVPSSCFSTRFTSGLRGLVTSKVWLVISGDTIWRHYCCNLWSHHLLLILKCMHIIGPSFQFPIPWYNEKASFLSTKCFSTQTHYIFIQELASRNQEIPLSVSIQFSLLLNNIIPTYFWKGLHLCFSWYVQGSKPHHILSRAPPYMMFWEPISPQAGLRLRVMRGCSKNRNFLDFFLSSLQGV